MSEPEPILACSLHPLKLSMLKNHNISLLQMTWASHSKEKTCSECGHPTDNWALPGAARLCMVCVYLSMAVVQQPGLFLAHLEWTSHGRKEIKYHE